MLTNQWGKASSGEILAIMGPSGTQAGRRATEDPARRCTPFIVLPTDWPTLKNRTTGSGKTSLLNALAGRVLYSKGATLSGWVLVNGRPRNDGAFKRISAYVMQDDVLYAFLTVKETIWMSAQLQIPPSVPLAEKQRQVEAIIQELGLVKAQHTIIGNERARGVSGGERRVRACLWVGWWSVWDGSVCARALVWSGGLQRFVLFDRSSVMPIIMWSNPLNSAS